MFATARSATVLGVEGRPVTVEVHSSAGLPGFTIVGLPDASCREARDRARAAVLSAKRSWPAKRITVNLAPTGLRKVGAGLDLAIAVGVLAADEAIPAEALVRRGFIGELGLDGTVRTVPGMVCLVDALDVDEVVVPPAAVPEAELVGRHRVRAVATLAELVGALTGDEPWPDHDPPDPPPEPLSPPDLADVRGHPFARRAVEVAAAGGHHLLVVGPPGAGKTMLAERLPGLLPPLELEEARDVIRVHSAAGLPWPGGGRVVRPPFRAPHHTATTVALVGGGTVGLRPGELSLASHGVLFLDELAEFRAQVLDALREPLEDGVVRVARAHATVDLPARVLLVAAMNPCPCGEAGTPGACRCSERSRARYHRRLSGPLLDRFDLRVDVQRPQVDDLLHGPPGEATSAVAVRVAAARDRARRRGVRCNAELRALHLESVAPLDDGARQVLEGELRRGRLSARGVARVRRVALTLADLEHHDGPLADRHIGLALAFRTDPLGADHVVVR